jgi:hypothetical protein
MASRGEQTWADRYGPWAVITGASDGIDGAMARIASRGVHVVLAARREDLLRRVGDDLSAEYGLRTRIVAIDLADNASATALTDATSDLDVGLVAACAGFGSSGLFIDRPIAGEIECCLSTASGVGADPSLRQPVGTPRARRHRLHKFDRRVSGRAARRALCRHEGLHPDACRGAGAGTGVARRRCDRLGARARRFDSERLQELGGRVPLGAGVLEVVVVRPHRKVQREREGEHVDVVRIALADSAPGCRELALILRSLHHRNGEGCAGQEQRVQLKPLLFGQGRQVLEPRRRPPRV